VLRNALLPLVTNIGMRLSGLLGGVVVIEMVFSWQGMGLLILEASRAMDYPLMQGAFLLLAIITISSNFLTDMMYVFVDPRIKFT
jgi:peptide/nickel transport system permease protein